MQSCNRAIVQSCNRAIVQSFSFSFTAYEKAEPYWLTET